MDQYRRRLPHVYSTDYPVFLPWCLFNSLPSHRVSPPEAIRSGNAFVTLDRLLDEASTGNFDLRQPAIADIGGGSNRVQRQNLKHYEVHAWAIMPNHVHLLATPAAPIPKLTRSLIRNNRQTGQRHPRVKRNSLLAGRKLYAASRNSGRSGSTSKTIPSAQASQQSKQTTAGPVTDLQPQSSQFFDPYSAL